MGCIQAICEQFLGPLLLSKYHNTDLQKLWLAWPEGVPLELTHKLLPQKSRFSMAVNLHIHLHARVARKANVTGEDKPAANFGRQKIMQLLDSLESLVKKLELPQDNTVWRNYYAETATREEYLEEKKALVKELLQLVPVRRKALDLGANEGLFSQMLLDAGFSVVSTDADSGVVNFMYREKALKQAVPLIVDLSAPTPAMGVDNRERYSFWSGCEADLVLALALIHHLMIGKRMRLEDMVTMLAKTGDYLIVEYVPEEDPKAQALLRHWPETPTLLYGKQHCCRHSLPGLHAWNEEYRNSGRVLLLMNDTHNCSLEVRRLQSLYLFKENELMKDIRSILKTLPLFLILLPSYVLLHLEYDYHHLIEYRFVWKDLAWIIAMPVIFLFSFLPPFS